MPSPAGMKFGEIGRNKEVEQFNVGSFREWPTITGGEGQPNMSAIRRVSAYSLTSTILPCRRVKSMWYWFS